MKARLLLLLAFLMALAAALLLFQPWVERPGGAIERTPDADTIPVEGDAHGGAKDPPVGPVLRGHVPPPVPEVPLAPAECAVAGRVVHGDTGSGLTGVPVLAVSCEGPGEGRTLRSVLSGEHGRFLVRGLEEHPRRVLLVATGGDWVNAEVARELASWDAVRSWEVDLRPGEAVPWTIRVLPGAHLEGTVHDADGAPVAGATVRVPQGGTPSTPPWSQPSFPWHLIPAGRTDAVGHFALHGLPYGDDLLVEAVRTDGVAADSESVAFRPPATATVAIVLPAVRTARVRVVDQETGQIVAGAEVQLRTRGGRRAARWGRTVATDGEGRATLTPVSAESVTLVVSALGYHRWRSLKHAETKEDAWRLFEEGADGVFEATVSLERAATLSGRVVGPAGWPLHLLYVSAVPADGQDAQRVQWAQCDADGRFALTVPTERRWAFQVLDPTEELVLAEPVEADSGASDVVLRMRSRPRPAEAWEGPVWELRLVGADDLALTEATAEVQWAGWGDYPPFGDGKRSWIVFKKGTGKDGDTVLTCRVPVSLEHGEIWVEVAAHAGDVDFPEMDHGPLGPRGGTATITIPRPRRVEGRVVDPTGRPVQGVELWIHAHRPPGMPASWWYFGLRDQALSDAEGRFGLRNLHTGIYELRVERAEGWVCPANREVEAGARDVVVRLLDGVEVAITVTDEQGAPVEGAFVRAEQTDGVRGSNVHYWADHMGVVTDVQGVAVLKALETTGTFTLKVVPPKARVEELVYVLRKDWTPRDDAVVLSAYRRVSGEVRSPAGEPVAGARVMVEFARGTDKTTSDARGRFELLRVEPGPVRLGAWLPSLEPEDVRDLLIHEAEAGADDVVLVVDPGRAVRLDVTGLHREGDRVERLRLTAIDAGDTTYPVHRCRVPEGAEEVTVKGLAPGVRYRAWAGPTDDGLFASTVIEPGDERVDVTLRQGGTIQGTIRWPGEIHSAWIGIGDAGVHLGRWISNQPETFELKGVPDGTWRVTLWWEVDGKRHRRHVQATAGGTLTFDLTEER